MTAPITAPATSRGVVFFGTNDGSGAYTDPKGNAGVPWTLTNANFEAGEWFPVGPTDRELFLDVSGVISVAMASALVIVEAQARDPRNGSALLAPFVCGTVRVDKQSNATVVRAPEAQQTIARADLAGQSVSANKDGSAPAAEVLDVVLRTVDQRGAFQARVLVKGSNAAQAGDTVVVYASVGK